MQQAATQGRVYTLISCRSLRRDSLLQSTAPHHPNPSCFTCGVNDPARSQPEQSHPQITWVVQTPQPTSPGTRNTFKTFTNSPSQCREDAQVLAEGPPGECDTGRAGTHTDGVPTTAPRPTAPTARAAVWASEIPPTGHLSRLFWGFPRSPAGSKTFPSFLPGNEIPLSLPAFCHSASGINTPLIADGPGRPNPQQLAFN